MENGHLTNAQVALMQGVELVKQEMPDLYDPCGQAIVYAREFYRFLEILDHGIVEEED